MSKKVIQFEPFKNCKQWEDDYTRKFLGYIERYFIKDKDPNKTIDAENMCKRMYYTLRFLEGNANAFMIFTLMGVPLGEFERVKKYLINWLEDILNKLKEY